MGEHLKTGIGKEKPALGIRVELVRAWGTAVLCPYEEKETQEHRQECQCHEKREESALVPRDGIE